MVDWVDAHARRHVDDVRRWFAPDRLVVVRREAVQCDEMATRGDSDGLRAVDDA